MKYLLTILALALLTVSCTKNPLASSDDDFFIEGEKITLRIALKEPSMNVVTRSELTSAEEEEIHSVAIFIIDKVSNLIVTSVFHDHLDVHDYPDKNLEVETLAGNDRNIYVIANYDANLIDGLKTVATCEEAESLIAQFYGNPLLREFGLAKTGKLTNQKIRKNQLVTVPLEYITAKITTNVINQSPDFTVLGWAMGNIPTLTYAFEGTADALTNEDYYQDLEGQMIPFEQKPATAGPGSIDFPLNYSNTFYVYENRRGEWDLTKPEPPAGWPYGNPTDTRQPYQKKAWYAPKNATYIKIYGKWKDGTTSREVIITHYLGANNYNDYNIKRGMHYTYNVTIKNLNTSGNLNNITIDTNVSMKESNLTVITPAQLMNLDAHYCYRPITINVQEVTESGSKISIEVLESANSTVPSHWLDLSATLLFAHHVRDDGSMPLEGFELAINTWLQHVPAWHYARPKFVPNKQDRSSGGIAAGYTPPGGMTIDYTNSTPNLILPDNDNVMEYKPQNYHRMVKKFTGLPTGADDDPKKTSVPVHIILYAKEYPLTDLNNPLAAAFREAVVRITLERPGKAPEYTHFTVRQYPPHIFAQMGSDILLVERVEEYALLMRPSIDINMQVLGGMQWGSWDIPETAVTNANAATNGFSPTLLGVYRSATNDPVMDPNNYNGSNSGNNFRLPMYGSLQGAWDKTNKGEIRQGSASYFAGKLQGQPYFNIPLSDYNNAVNVNYNTTAARYCHEKNWDENGDGVIAGTEVKWYLPSTAEVQLFWTYHEILNLYHEYYWTSNQVDANSAYALSMEHAQAEPHRLYNGIRQPYPKTLFSARNAPRVRCIRRIPATSLTQNTPLLPLVYHSAATSIVDCSSLPGNMTTTQSKMGITQSNPGELQSTNQRVYKKLEVQRTQPSAPVSYAKLHSENRCDQNKGWRLPTQRELLILYSVRSKLEANTSFARFENGTYWSMTSDLSRQYLVEFDNNGMAKVDNASENSNAYYYRCVREIP